MYIRKRTRRGHTYYSVVRGKRCDGTVRQHQVCNIGRIDKIAPEDRREIESDLAELDPTLLPDFYELLVEHEYDFTADQDYQSQYPLEEVTPTEAVDYGPVAALHAIAEKFELPSVLESHLQPKGGGPPLGDLLLIHSALHVEVGA